MPTKTKTKSKTKFQQIVTRIESSNKKFQKASKAAKIVMVAKDVLAILNARRIKAVGGIYVDMGGIPYERTIGLKDMSELMKLPALPACSVCAIGAAMFATTLRLDNVPIQRETDYNMINAGADYTCQEGLNQSSNMSDRARSVFPHELLRRMEDAFGYRQSTANGRLAAIYENLVKNKGKKFTDHKTGGVIWKQ